MNSSLAMDGCHQCDQLTLTTHTCTDVLQPFVWDNLGGPVPEETFTHSHLKRVL